MERLFVTLALMIELSSCNSQINKNNSCEKSEFFNISMSIPSEVKNDIKSDKALFFNALNTSNDQQAFEVLNTGIQLTKDSNNSFALQPSIDSRSSQESKYMAYRFFEYLGNISKQELINQLLLLYDKSKDSNSCVNKLAEIEVDYLSFFNLYDSTSKKNKLLNFENYIKKYPESNRLKYLYSKMLYELGQFQMALSFFYNLIEKGYYEKPIFDCLFEYYSNKNTDSIKYYSTIFSESFPMLCNLGTLDIIKKTTNNDIFLNECKKCFKSRLQSDSIKAKISLGWYYLNNSKYNEIEILFNEYQKRNTKYNPARIKVQEAGEYFDIYLRSLFLQKQYKKLFTFLIQNVGYNEKIQISTNDDFYQLIENYYKEYYDKSGQGFNNFYISNFSWVPAGSVSL